MKAEFDESEDVEQEMKQVSEMESQENKQKQDPLPGSQPSAHGEADIGGTDQVVTFNGKEELTPAMDEKKHVVTEDLVADKVVQEKGGAEKVPPFSATRPATMPTVGVNLGDEKQLTLFYAGRVWVFESIPAEKVQEIMLTATAAATTTTVKPADTNNIGTQSPFVPSAPSNLPSPQTTTTALAAMQALCLPSQKSSLCRIQEFPISRRQSLQRFLEKRRDRLASKCPYLSPSSKIDDSLGNKLGDSGSPDSVNFKQSEEEHQPSVLAS